MTESTPSDQTSAGGPAERSSAGPPLDATPRPVREVAAGIILRGPYVLIARRLEDAHLGGLWEFPGGQLEPGETLEECLVREIQEELNLTIRVGRHTLTVHQSYPDRDVRVHFYYATPVAGTPEAVGCQEFRWVLVDDLGKFDFPPADQPLIARLKSVTGH